MQPNEDNVNESENSMFGKGVKCNKTQTLAEDKRKFGAVKKNAIGNQKKPTLLGKIPSDLKSNKVLAKKMDDSKMIQLGPSGAHLSEMELQQICQTLKRQLQTSQKESQCLTEQVSELQSQLETLPDSNRQLRVENEMLTTKICDVRIINQQKQNEIDELRQMVKNLETKLWEQSTDIHHEEKILLQRLMNEYDNLLKDYDRVRVNNKTIEGKLYEARSRIRELNSKLYDFEINFKRIETENNFLRRKILTESFYESSSHYRDCNPRAYIYQPNHSDQSHFFRMGSSQELLRSRSREITPIETDRMSISCYGALPSHNDKQNNDSFVISSRRFGYKGCRDHNIDEENEMTQSLYVQPHHDIDNITTPTNERGRFSILETSKLGKQGSSSLNEWSNSLIGLESLQRKRSNSELENDQHREEMRQRSDACNRELWAKRKSDEEKDLEKRYDQLQNIKRQLLMSLSHVTSSGYVRNKRTNRETTEYLKAQLDEVDREIGLLRMTFKQKQLLKR